MSKFKQYLYENRFAIAKLVCCVAGITFLYAVYMGISYTRPMRQEKFTEAYDSFAADAPIVLYDVGLQQYKADEHAKCLKVLTEAFNACHRDGGIPPARTQLAADIKFIMGNALVKMNKKKAAIDAYKECLRLDPDNMEAKNNLESLLQMNNGKGPPQDAPGSGPGGGPKRGI